MNCPYMVTGRYTLRCDYMLSYEEIVDLLGRLRIHPITVPIPFASAGKHVHFYFVEDSQPAIFDTGLYNEANERWIERSLNKLGYTIRDVKRVFLTHGHIDHYGNARLFQEQGAEVFLHPADKSKATGLSDEETRHFKGLYVNEFLKHGFPDNLVDHVDAIFLDGNRFARKVLNPTPVHEGDRFQFDRFEVKVVGFPGHTPGCVGYFFGDSGVAVTGDHLLKSISPNPLFELSAEGEKFHSLVSYFASLEKALRCDIKMALPAHGPFITDPRELIEGLTAFYRRRQGKIFKMLEEPAGAFALCQTYYRRLKDLETFLGFSEILGNLDMMAIRGEIVQEEVGGKYLFRRLTDEPLPLLLAS